MKYILVIFAIFQFALIQAQTTTIVTAPKVSTDTIKKNEKIADSLKLVSNVKLKLLKKGAHASYYHNKFNGRKTASGVRFDNKKYTAAHRKLPFGTKVKVTNESNKKSVIVTVNDRGPFTKGRDIDLTERAFKDLTNGKSGALKVTIEIIE